MSNIEDLMISKMSESEKSKAVTDLMKNNPGWSYDTDLQKTMRKLGSDRPISIGPSIHSETSESSHKVFDFFFTAFFLIIAFIVISAMFGLGYLIGSIFDNGIFVGLIFGGITLWIISSLEP